MNSTTNVNVDDLFDPFVNDSFPSLSSSGYPSFGDVTSDETGGTLLGLGGVGVGVGGMSVGSVILGIGSGGSGGGGGVGGGGDGGESNYVGNTTSTTTIIGESDPSDELNWWALLTLIVPLLAVFGNLLVILAVRNEPRLQTRTNSFLLSLAVCDSLVALLVIPPSCLALFTGNWRLGGGVGCLVWLFLDVFFCTASILHLATLSVDRYLSLRFPWRFGREKSRSRLMLTILFVWFAAVSLALFLPISLCLKYTQVQDSVLVEGQCVIPDPAYRVWASLVCFYLPLLAMVATYALTVRLLRKHPLRMPERNYSIPLKRRLQRGEETHFTPCPEVFGQQVSTETDSSSFSCELCEENSGRLKRKRTATWKCRLGEVDTGNHVMTHTTTTTTTMLTTTMSSTSSSATTTNNPSFKEVIPSGTKLSPPNNLCKVKTKTESISLTSFDYQIPASRTSSSTTKYWDENVSRASWRLLARLSKNASNRRILRSERKATKVLGVVFFAFVGLWLPFFALNVTAALWPGSPGSHWYLHDQIMEGATWIGWTSSLINPFLYTAFNQDFRNAFSRLLQCKCRKQPPVRL